MGKVPRYTDEKDASMNIVTMLSQADIPVSSLWDLELLGIRDPIEQNSRGCGPKQLQKCKGWQGPAWLQNPKEQWPKSAVNIDEKEVEIEKGKSLISANNTELESISLQLARRFS
ncbi:uncharacterized protein NPIL_233431 [Nephila pilipes]|uniref:Uncharacterized protein n=1 Tax=Nephila pilipes TaxID=299642 RepID=A0A8X6NI11_NEPPI|nr:uncharacterized protein NPIL_233431 [Nephila pilipes]